MDFTSSFERKVKYGVFETGTCAHFYSNTTLLGLLRYSHELRYRDYSLLRSAKPPPTPRGVTQNYVKDSGEIVVSR